MLAIRPSLEHNKRVPLLNEWRPATPVCLPVIVGLLFQNRRVDDLSNRIDKRLEDMNNRIDKRMDDANARMSEFRSEVNARLAESAFT